MTIDADSANWTGWEPLPYAGAFVQVALADGTLLTDETDENGIVLFEHPELTGRVDLTVGAEGSRYATFFDLGARNVTFPVASLDPLREGDEDQVGSLMGTVTGLRWGARSRPLPGRKRHLRGVEHRHRAGRSAQRAPLVDERRQRLGAPIERRAGRLSRDHPVEHGHS